MPARGVASWLLLLLGALSGIGLGLAQAAMTDTILESIPHRKAASPPASNAIVRTIGGSLGYAVLAEILTSHADPHGIPAERVFTMDRGNGGLAKVQALHVRIQYGSSG